MLPYKVFMIYFTFAFLYIFHMCLCYLKLMLFYISYVLTCLYKMSHKYLNKYINTHAIELTANTGGLKSVSVTDRFAPPGLVSVGYK